MPSLAGSNATRSEDPKGWKSPLEPGESLLFPPRYTEVETVRESLLHLLHQSPSSAGLSQTRWTLQGVLQATHEWLRLGSVPGMSQLFHRLKLHWKRGRYHVHSPDEQYLLKLRTIKLHLLGAENEKRTFVFVDEFTLYRHPSLACAYEPAGQR